MPLLGGDPINRAYHFLAHNSVALPGLLLLVVVNACLAFFMCSPSLNRWCR
jgi:hypothetical protein